MLDGVAAKRKLFPVIRSGGEPLERHAHVDDNFGYFSFSRDLDLWAYTNGDK